MSKKKLTISQINDIVETEGLGYAIEDYLASNRIADADLADMWAKASELLKEIQSYIEDNIFDDGEEERDEDEDEEETDY